jgi:DNA-directed RNA polymerase I, II, and III subunit RPABC1
MDRMAAQKGMIIHAEKMSSVAAKVSLASETSLGLIGELMGFQTMQEMSSEYHLEAFKESDLLVNITRHFLVPKHQIMTPKDKAALILK